MNTNMEIKLVTFNFAAELAANIAELRNPTVSTIEAIIRDFSDNNRNRCDICHRPYEKAAYLSNGDTYEEFRGGTICKSCLEKALEVIG